MSPRYRLNTILNMIALMKSFGLSLNLYTSNSMPISYSLSLFPIKSLLLNSSSHSLRTKCKRHIPRRRTPNTSTTKLPRRTHRSRRPHTTLPSALTNINRRPRSRRIKFKQCCPARSSGRCWRAAAFRDRACDTAADGELGDVFVVRDYVA